MRIEIDGQAVDFHVPAELLPAAMRTLAGATVRDREIDALIVPSRPRLIALAVRTLRLYRRWRPLSISCRCVFDPSCSRYAELAFRKYGFFGGLRVASSRLHRCRPGNGGVDLP